MTKEQLAAIPRKDARKLLAEIPAGQGYDDRVLLAVEGAMNIEWWRGFHAEAPAVTDDMIRRACNAYGSSQSSCEFEWMREALTAALREKAATATCACMHPAGNPLGNCDQCAPEIKKI